jgi:hypothetical protein
VSALDPAARELLAAIAAVLDVHPKPTRTDELPDWWQKVTDRAAVVRTACTVLLEHQSFQTEQARRLAAELRRIVAGQPDRPPDPPLLTRPLDWPRGGGER